MASLKYIEDLKSYFEKRKVQEIFKIRRSFWKELNTLPKEELNTFLKNALAKASEHDKKIILSAILDINEMHKEKVNIKNLDLKKLLPLPSI